MTSLKTQSAHRPKVGVAAVLAAGLLLGAVVPSAAATWAPVQSDGASHHRSSFHRHFWRGSQLSQAPVPSAEMTALVDEPGATEEAISYCANRFRSYDPSTGTYLGYDGDEHPCP